MDFLGWQELLLVAVVALIVIGPERLPETLRTLGLWMGRLRRSFVSVKTEIEKEIGMDDIRRQLHNESVMAEMRKIEEEVKSSMDPAISVTEGPPLYSDDTAPRPEPATQTAAPTDENHKKDEKDQKGEAGEVDTEPSGVNAPEASLEDARPPLPRSEAELEAVHEARQKLKEADSS
jgi:sec-independent protein translocase protein TatB